MAFAISTGQDGQRFKYNDKELDLMHELNMYDYSARHIDMGNPRFTTQDPLTEKYYSISSYAYCANNPIMFIDSGYEIALRDSFFVGEATPVAKFYQETRLHAEIGEWEEDVEETEPQQNTTSGAHQSILNLDDLSNPKLAMVMYYDYKGQLIQSKSKNHLGGVEKEYIAYNFTGQPVKRKQVHSTTSQPELTEIYSYTYDRAGRLTQTRHQSGTDEMILADNTYDELGRLKTSMPNNQEPLKTTYTYNIRSWINDINNDYFSESLVYTYNGNISSMQWGQKSQANQPFQTGRYAFTYDNLSRLKTAANSSWGSYMNFDVSYSYDKHGNIKTLSRYGLINSDWGIYGLIDNLTMDYGNSNQLRNITDTGIEVYSNGSQDFKDYHTGSGIEYEYNANGAMTKDLNKGITEIKYNVFNLPVQMNMINSSGLEAQNKYTYTATGAKLKVTHHWKQTNSNTPIIGMQVSQIEYVTDEVETTDYVGNKIYKNGVLEKILTGNGYYESGNYYFYLRDHLGNNRIVADQASNIVQSNQYYPFGMMYSGGTGQEAQPFKYGGKELDLMNGLNTYDFLARGYDPAYGRFMSIDPMAEKYYNISPYAYCVNNPLLYIDPNGEDLYLYYYLSDNYKNGEEDEASNRMFWAAMLTRSIDIANNLKDGDKAIVKPISKTSDFKSTIEGDIADNKDTFGATKEVGIWSHGGFDGPLRHPQEGPIDQAPVSDWSNIDFNWSSDGASISFYGCQTGRTNPETGQAFNEILSGYANFSNVDVWGQTSRSWPSPDTNYRYVTPSIESGNHGYPTYMVGSHKGIMGFLSRYTKTQASPMSIFKNGKLQGYKYQPGK
jgi:RHS repeat-associated protein